MTADFSSNHPPPLEPRLGGRNLEPPINPVAYFFVGFLLGFISMAYLAVVNAGRLSRDAALRTKTIAVGAGITIVGLVLLFVAPASWVDNNTNSRILIQVVGAVGSMIFHRLHHGPALTRTLGGDEFMSAWKKIVPLVLTALVQAVIAFMILRSRGLR